MENGNHAYPNISYFICWSIDPPSLTMTLKASAYANTGARTSAPARHTRALQPNSRLRARTCGCACACGGLGWLRNVRGSTHARTHACTRNTGNYAKVHFKAARGLCVHALSVHAFAYTHWVRTCVVVCGYSVCTSFFPVDKIQGRSIDSTMNVYVAVSDLPNSLWGNNGTTNSISPTSVANIPTSDCVPFHMHYTAWWSRRISKNFYFAQGLKSRVQKTCHGNKILRITKPPKLAWHRILFIIERKITVLMIKKQ